MAQVIYVDVDDTLVRSVGNKRIPVPAVVQEVRRLKSTGAELFLWSSAGANYSRATAEEFGLADCFTAYLPKPTTYIDDQPVQDWRYCTHVHPMQVGS